MRRGIDGGTSRGSDIRAQGQPFIEEKGAVVPPVTVFVILLALLGLTLPATATTTQVEVSGTQQLIGFQPGHTWMSGPVQHMRGGQSTSVVSPASGLPPQGLNIVEVNFNLDTRTGEGRTWGTGDLRFEGGGFETTFTGDISVGPNGPEGVFRVVGHGYGSFEGMRVRILGHEILMTGFTTFEGILFEPGGA